MGWDNAGGYNRQHNFSADASANIKILASRMDAELDDVASAMTIAWARNGQNVPTQNIPMGGRTFINVGAATSVNNFMRVREFIENVPIFMQDQESSADRISVSAQFFTSVSANQAPGDGTRIIVRAGSDKASAVMYLNGHSANVEFQDGNRAVNALISGGVYEMIFSSADVAWKVTNPDDGRTTAERAAGVTPTSFQYQPGDVRRYGAVGDNSTDDTTALVNAGKSSLEVFIHPSLTCRVTASLAAGTQAGQRWYGGGKITTADGFNFTVFTVSGTADVTFDGIEGESGTLGADYSTATARFIEFVSTSPRGQVRNCKITGFQQAVRVHGSVDCQVLHNNIISPIGWGISVQTDADDCKVIGNRVSGCVNEHGIYVSGSSGNVIRSPHVAFNTVNGSAIDGIKLTYCDDARVSSNTTFDNGGQGIYSTVGTSRADIHDNVSYGNGEQGILVFDSTTNTDGCLVHDNQVYLNDGDGIRVQASGAGSVTNTKVHDNVVTDNNQSAGSFRGISLSGDTDTQVRNNTVTDETTAINVAAGTNGALIDNNTFSGNTTNIANAGTGTIVRQPGSIETRTGAGAISLLTEITLIVTTGINALTLADGYEGQRKFLKMKTDGGDGTLTPTNLAGGTTITFDDAGDTADLVFLDGEWGMVGGSATLA